MPEADAILKVDDLRVHFPLRGGFLGLRSAGSVHAVDGVSFSVGRGETFGIVGESGCGKSTLGLALLRMLDTGSGTIELAGETISGLKGRALQRTRRSMQMIYQDPFGALNPRMPVIDLIGEPLVIHKLYSDRIDYRRQVLRLMDLVGLKPAMANRYAHEFSGGQRQRISIARALAGEPSFLICDEPTSALDVSVQAQILNLMKKLQAELGLTYLLISHNLAVVYHMSARVGVMYLGRIVEQADTRTLFNAPRHPYTRMLLDAVPDLAMTGRRRIPIAGDVPSPLNPPSGCAFHPRCPFANARCKAEVPRTHRAGDTVVACHGVEEGRIPA
mgnify:CR=1 FL=1